MEKLLGFKHTRTTPYHPQCNGIVERWHRDLKSAIRCHATDRWVDVLPTILLGMRASIKSDINATTSQLVYGTTIRIPGQLIYPVDLSKINQTDFIRILTEDMLKLQPKTTSNHNHDSPFIHKDLSSCSKVFVRNDRIKKPLQSPYDGPFDICERNEKFFKVNINGRESNISIDRLKPAFSVNECNTLQPQIISNLNFKDNVDQNLCSSSKIDNKQNVRTRSGRSVHFSEHF